MIVFQLWLNWRIVNIKLEIMKMLSTIVCSCGNRNLTTLVFFFF